MARKFNPEAAYGTVFPAERGAIFYQDGGYFSATGDLVFEDHPATPPVVIETEETVVEVVGDKTKSKTKTVKTEIPVVEPGDPKQILAQWLKGELVLAHGSVRKYVKDGYGKVLSTKDQIIEFLAGEGLVPAEQINVKPAAK